MSEQSEAATRRSVYEIVYNKTDQRLLKEGIKDPYRRKLLSMREAGHQAIEVLNFSRKGNNLFLNIITSTVPFINARIQGLDRLGRSAVGRDPFMPVSKDQALQTFWRRGAFLAAMSSLYTVAMSVWDDDDYNNLPDYVKDDYWIVPFVGGMLSLPIPFEVGVMFKMIPEQLTKLAMGGETREMKRAALHAMGSTLNFNPVPQFLKPAMESMFNYNMFTKRDIVPYYMLERSADRQFRPTTPQSARHLASLISAVVPGDGVSSLKVEHLIRGQWGTLGSYAMSVADEVIHWTGFGYGTQASRRARDYPFMKRFFRDEFGGGNKQIYYELKNEVANVVADLSSMKGNEPERAAELSVEKYQLLALKPFVSSMDRSLKQIRNQRNWLILSEMEPSLKRRSLDDLDRTENELMKSALVMRRMLQ